MAKKTTSSTPAPKLPAKASASAKATPKLAAASKTADVTPPPPGKAAVVTLKQLAVQFGDTHELPAKQAQAMLDSVVSLLVDHLKAGDKLRLTGLGHSRGEGPPYPPRAQPGDR